jgi:hypothetical protein
VTETYACKSTNIIYVVMFYILTAGIGGVVWLLYLANQFKHNDCKVNKLFVSARTLLFVYIVGLFILILLNVFISRQVVFGVFFATILTLAIISYVVFGYLSYYVGLMISRYESEKGIRPLCSGRIAFFLTILGFLSSIYLQIHVNRLGESEIKRDQNQWGQSH